MTPPIKLNVGCGNKCLDGYVNIDVAQRDGKQPDIEADIRDLPLDENYADELMAIHVIEHFYEWEVNDVIQEWKRVLKPGGKIILECPDLIKATLGIINHVSLGVPISARMSMWALYGDPSHKDPLMCHRWAYTPHTLAQKLAENGFTDIKHEEAVYHWPQRDMRLTGVKP